MPETDDSIFFVENPTAQFRLRSWRPIDDRHATGDPPFGTDAVDRIDMELVTISFRSGCRTVQKHYPIDLFAWMNANIDAHIMLDDAPELGFDGDNLPEGQPS